MEPSNKKTKASTCSDEGELKLHFKNKNETDSSISLTFDSASDCGYKSGEITAMKENYISASDNSSVQSKLEHNTTYDSGLVSDCFSTVSSENLSSLKETLILKSTRKNTDEMQKYSFKDIFSQDKDGDNVLHLAIIEAGSDVIFPLINLAPHPDFLDIYNNMFQTLLHLATLTGKCHVVRKLVVAGASLDMQDHNGNTPLHIAARRGDLDCVEAILNPITELEVEKAKCSYKIYTEFQDLSLLINLRNYDGVSCVHLAANGGFIKVMECLYNHSANINAQDGKTGSTPLHFAVQNGTVKLVELLLLKCHSDPSVQNYAGRSSMYIAHSLCKQNSSKVRQDILMLLKAVWKAQSSSSEDETEDSTEEVDLDELLNARSFRSS